VCVRKIIIINIAWYNRVGLGYRGLLSWNTVFRGGGFCHEGGLLSGLKKVKGLDIYIPPLTGKP